MGIPLGGNGQVIPQLVNTPNVLQGVVKWNFGKFSQRKVPKSHSPLATMLYVADHGAEAICAYEITEDGSLPGKTIFVSAGSDRMTIDKKGNICLTSKGGGGVVSSGTLIETIPVSDPHQCLFWQDWRTNAFHHGKNSGLLGSDACERRVLCQEWGQRICCLPGQCHLSIADDGGLEPATAISKDAVANDAGKIGLEKVAYWLPKAVGW